MDNLVFSYFPPILEKQWKQQIQYILKGENYQNLIYTNPDGISTLPFYTQKQLEKKIALTYQNTPKPAYYCIVSEEKKANQELLEALNNGIKTLYLALFNPATDLTEVLNNVEADIIVQCYFLSNQLNTKILKQKKAVVLEDCIGKVSKTGNWYINAKTDFKTINTNLKKEKYSISINLSTFHNAGATPLQQLSYSISQLIAYSKHLKLKPDTIVYYHTAVSNDLCIEVAKLKALRILHTLISESTGIHTTCKIIHHKSKRHLSGLHIEINEALSYSERQIAILGEVDFFLSNPINFYFYKEDVPSILESCEDLIIASTETDYSSASGSIYIEKLTQQLVEKSLELISTLQDGGGFIEQLKKETIQHKIKDHEKTETSNFYNTVKENLIPITTLKTPIVYPFLKFKKRKTLWKPVIEKQLREAIEHPIWEQNYKL